MQIIDLLNAHPVLQRLMSEKMPVRLAYAVQKNFRLMEQEIKVFDDTRLKLLEENWKLNKETNQFDVPDEDKERWRKMFAELAESESTFVPYVIDFSLVDGLQLTPGEMLAISWMFKEA